MPARGDVQPAGRVARTTEGGASALGGRSDDWGLVPIDREGARTLGPFRKMFVERFRDAGVKAAREACYGGGHASGDSATVMLVLHMESGFDRLEVARVTVEDDGGMDERLLGCLVRSQEGIVLDMPGLTSSQRYRVTWPIVASRR